MPGEEMHTLTKEIDPVCGMAVDPARAKATFDHAGKKYVFCCQSCADKFRAAPEKYLDAKPPQHTHMDHRSQFVQVGGIKSAAAAAAPTTAPAKAAPTPQPAAPAPTQQAYVCPMCPEVRESRPVACPKCGMALEPELATAPTTRIEYTCPMHPEIVRPAPGACPICGMALEPRTVAVAQEENHELVSMPRRSWSSVALPIPRAAPAMSDLSHGQPVQNIRTMRAMG